MSKGWAYEKAGCQDAAIYECTEVRRDERRGLRGDSYQESTVQAPRQAYPIRVGQSKSVAQATYYVPENALAKTASKYLAETEKQITES